MFSILNKFKKYWINNGFIFMVLLSLAFLAIYWIICCITRSNGSYTDLESFKLPFLSSTNYKKNT